MAQFDLHRHAKRGLYPFLVDIQADLLAGLATRVVVPLVPLRRYGTRPITRLNPLVAIGGREHVVVVQELAAVPATALGAVVGSLAARRADLLAALDLLLTGV